MGQRVYGIVELIDVTVELPLTKVMWVDKKYETYKFWLLS